MRMCGVRIAIVLTATFADIIALSPRVLKLRVARIAALLEPRTTGSATAEFAGFLGGAALGTADDDCLCVGQRRHSLYS